jgi:hypothetical protein
MVKWEIHEQPKEVVPSKEGKYSKTCIILVEMVNRRG